MRKILSVMLALFLLAIMTTAVAEVTFNSIPFLVSDDEVIAGLIEKGFVRKDTSFALSNENGTYLVANEILGYQPAFNQSYSDYCFSQHISGFGRIAGFPVKSMNLTYAYDGVYKLIALKVDMLGANYATLNEKLTKVYGSPDVRRVEEEGIVSNIWKDGETSVVLYTENDGYDYTLIYGRTDAEEILANCLVSDPDDVLGL